MIADAVQRLSSGRNLRFSILLAIFAGALALRLLAVFESLDNPSFFFPIVDAGAYDAIARELAANGNISPRLFWQPFLYPVFLAATYLISGGSILAAKVLQAIIGSLTCSLVFILGNRQLGKNVGLAAATITALYGPVILFEGELLAAGLAAFFAVLLVLLFTIVADRSRPLLVVTLGIVAGLSLLTRPTIAPFLAVTSLVLLLLAGRRRGWKPALVSAGLGLSGFLLVVIPVALLSQSVTGDLGVLPSSGGLNAYIGNNPSMCETLTIRPGDDWGRLLDQPNRAGYEGPAESNRYFYREVGRFAREEPSRFLIGLGAKTLRLISSRELPRNFDPYLAGEWSWLQRGLTWKVGHFGFPFGLLLPLAVVGVARSWRRLGLPAILFMTLYPAAIILIFVAARYRAPMIPVLSLAAAAGGAALISDFRRRRWRRLGIAASAMTAIVLLSTVPGPFCEEEASLRADFFYCLGHSHAERGEPDLAISSYQQALAENPNLPQVHYNLGLLFESRDDLDQAASHFTEATRLDPAHARALNNLGSVAESRGDLEEAERRFTRALGLDPELAVAQRNLGNVRLQLGRPGEALEPLRKALELEADDPNTLFLLGSSLLQTGDSTGAIESLERAVELKADPRFLNELGTALIGVRRLDEAVEQFRAAIELAPDYIDPYNNAGAALAMRGDILGASEFFRKAIERQPDYADAHYNLATLLLRMGRADEAKAELATVLRLRPDHPQALARLEELIQSSR